MKTKSIGQKWRLKSGLLYAGTNHQLQAVLVGPDEAHVYDSRDNPAVKITFFSAVLGCKFEVEPVEATCVR